MGRPGGRSSPAHLAAHPASHVLLAMHMSSDCRVYDTVVYDTVKRSVLSQLCYLYVTFLS